MCASARHHRGPHCVIEGAPRIGRDNRIFQFNSHGRAPQDMKYAASPPSW
jgi:acyl-[acyl carrier protein]--UDP-N-acetylglucosamine O-acyltransferase